MIAAGLDLSLTSTGIAYPGGDTRALNTPKRHVDGHARIDYILRQVHLAVIDPLIRSELDRLVVGIEGYAFGASQAGIRDNAELGGVIRHHLWTIGVPWVEISPKTLKKYATGTGTASKADMITAAQRHLDADITDDNCADAAWLRAAVRHHYGTPPGGRFPPDRAPLLDVIEWPQR